MNAPLSTLTLLPYCGDFNQLAVNKVIRFLFQWVCLFSTKVEKEKIRFLLLHVLLKLLIHNKQVEKFVSL